jgi:hypothetical protein
VDVLLAYGGHSAEVPFGQVVQLDGYAVKGVIGQVKPDWEVDQGGYVQLLEFGFGPDPAQHEQLGSAHSARGEDDLTRTGGDVSVAGDAISSGEVDPDCVQGACKRERRLDFGRKDCIDKTVLVVDKPSVVLPGYRMSGN